MYVCDPNAKHHGYKSWDGKLKSYLRLPFLVLPPFLFPPFFPFVHILEPPFINTIPLTLSTRDLLPRCPLTNTLFQDFFTRQIRPGVRPTASPSDPSIVANACESTPYALARRASLRAKFWIKAQPYSLLDVLAHDPLSAQFDRATVYQAFLSALSYHRWHSPVSGRVARAYVRDGTYFSEPLFESPDDPRLYEIDAAGFRASQGVGN